MSALGLSSRAIIGEFYARLAENTGAPWVDLTSMMFSSDQESETYKWLGQAPAMREWIGGRHAKGFTENGITIKNKKYEATLQILVDELRRDKTGQVLVRVREMADRVNGHWAKLLSTLIINGESTACYDSQFFFDTDHVEGDSGTQSNDLSITIATLPVSKHGSTTAPSSEEMEQSILQTIQAILGFKDDQGEPFNEGASKFLVMVPVPFTSSASAALKNDYLTSGVASTIKASNFSVELAVNPRLTWTTKFATFRTDGNVKPFIRQNEEDLKISAKAEGSEFEHDNDMHQYGIKVMRNVGYGYWQHACLATLA